MHDFTFKNRKQLKPYLATMIWNLLYGKFVCIEEL